MKIIIDNVKGTILFDNINNRGRAVRIDLNTRPIQLTYFHVDDDKETKMTVCGASLAVQMGVAFADADDIDENLAKALEELILRKQPPVFPWLKTDAANAVV